MRERTYLKFDPPIATLAPTVYTTVKQVSDEQTIEVSTRKAEVMCMRNHKSKPLAKSKRMIYREYA